MNLTNSLLIIGCILVILFCFREWMNIETFSTTIEDVGLSRFSATPFPKLMDYYDYITLPTASYNTLGTKDDGTIKQYFLEFQDEFYKKALSSRLYTPTKGESFGVSQLMGTDNVVHRLSKERKENIKARVSDIIQDSLNTYIVQDFVVAEDASQDTLFFVTDIMLRDVREIEDYVANNKTLLVSARCIVHRTGKAYGASITMTTFHRGMQSFLLDYSLDGFIFEDRIFGEAVPSNLMTNDHMLYSDIGTPNARIMRDETHEKNTMCRYLADMQKYRGIAGDALREYKCI